MARDTAEKKARVARSDASLRIICDESSCDRPAFYIVHMHLLDVCDEESKSHLDNDITDTGDVVCLLCSQCTAALTQCAAEMYAQLWAGLCPDCLAEGYAPQCNSCSKDIEELDDLIVSAPLLGGKA
jgi:hypothetical protein